MNGDNFFLDTNVFIYMFDSRDIVKQQRARQLVGHAIEMDGGCISYQVIQEFLNVLTKKDLGPSTRMELGILLEKYLVPLCRVHSSVALIQRTLDLQERWQYSFYDSLIIAAALQAGCTTLYSEDLQHGQKIETLIIVNPFLNSQNTTRTTPT